MEYLIHIIFFIIAVYCLGFSVYSGNTANNNIPDGSSSSLFIASYIICIIQCIIYLIGFIYVSIIGIYSCSKKPMTDENGDSKVKLNGMLPLLLNIYWIVIHFNYTISDVYDEYAKVKMIEFFVVLGIFLISLCLLFGFGISQVYKFSKDNSTVNVEKLKEDDKINDRVICTQV